MNIIEPPQFTPSYQSLFSPVRMEHVMVQSNEYIEGESILFYSPVQFPILSIVLNAVERYNINSDKWIDSGYKQPLEDTFVNTRSFLASLPDEYLYALQAEDIEPTPYGTFVLDFTKGQNKVSIEIGKDKIGYFTKYCDKINKMSSGVDFNENVPKEIIDSIESIFQ